MSKRVVEFFIVDILIAINKIKRYSNGFRDAQSFYYDEKSFDATMRELQIIGEATKKLINSNLLSDDFRVVVDFRNLIVHEYFGIDADEIWDILKNELPSFEKEILSLFKRADRKILTKIIDANKKELRDKSLQYLKDLEKLIKD